MLEALNDALRLEKQNGDALLNNATPLDNSLDNTLDNTLDNDAGDAPAVEASENAEVPAYPILEDGSPDFAQMTPEQQVAFAMENGGQQAVAETVQTAIEELNAQLESVGKKKGLVPAQRVVEKNRIRQEIAMWEQLAQPKVEEQAEIMPVGIGDFGPIYNQFVGKPQEAIEFLINKKGGEATGALSHTEIGPIDLVWGYEGTGDSDGYGWAKR